MTEQRTLGSIVLALALGVSLLLAGGAGVVSAHNNIQYEPGASGHCESGDNGGSFAVHAPADDHYNYADGEEAQSGTQMLVYFAETQGDCGGTEDKYLEVHVISAAYNVQYCYSEQSDGDDGDTGHSDEPTDPVTAGAGAGEVTVNDGSRNYPPGHPANDNEACEFNAHNNEST